MKKRLMTLAAVLCCAMAMMAEPISPSVARQAAMKFLQEKGTVLKNEAMRAKSRAMGSTADSQEPTEASPYYVFNATASQGFVVVSGDDCVGDYLVLGYTDQGCFDADAVPENMQQWLDGMASQITEMSRLGVKARTVATHDDVPYLMTTKWNQGSNIYNPQNPYNALCPMTDGLLCYSGCMATALSQVLYYHRWPQDPIVGELPAYTTCHGLFMESLPSVAFDWDNMVDDYNQPTTEAQQMAVATLMRYCGQLLQMDYTPQISNGYEYDMDILVNQFGIDQGVYMARAEEYSVSGWDELLYNELKEGRPLVHSGFSTSGGHAFVIDGYERRDGSGYFHVNWGWGGNANGFFKISLLNPDQLGTGVSNDSRDFSRNQKVLIGLQPAKNPVSNYCRYLSSYKWDMHDMDQPHIFNAINSSFMPGVFDIALAERHADGTLDYDHLLGKQTFEVAGYTFAELNSEEETGVCKFTLPGNVTEGLAPGNHKLVFVNRESGSEAPWRSIYGPNCYIEINIDEAGHPTDTLFHPLPQLTCSSRKVIINGPKMAGTRQGITATINNNSEEDFIGAIECATYYLLNDRLNLLNYSLTNIMIEGSSTADIAFTTTTPGASNYVVVFTRNGEDLTGKNVSEIKQTKGYIGHKQFSIGKLDFSCSEPIYKERNDEEGNPQFYIDLTINNGSSTDYDAFIIAVLYEPNSEGILEPMEFPEYFAAPLEVKAKSQNTVSIPLYKALKAGTYGIELSIANDFRSIVVNDYFIFAGGLFTIDSTAGIAQIENDKSIKEDSINSQSSTIYDLQGRRVSKPSRGLYIRNGKKVIGSLGL